MKLTLLFTLCFSFSIAYSQEFTEICSDQTTNGFVVGFQEYNGAIYGTGFFDILCGESIDYIAKWENGEWGPAEFGLSDPGHTMRVINDDLYVTRYEESNQDSNWVMVYDGVSAEKLGQGVFLTTATNFSNLANIYDVIDYNGTLVACGEFDRVGDQEISGIMQLDGTSWGPMGSGLTGNIAGSFPLLFAHGLYVDGDDLYVLGNFRFAGGVEVNGVGKWNGTEWEAMGSGLNGTVYSMIRYNGELLVGGSFTENGNGEDMNRMARWNGTDWEPYDFGFTQGGAPNFIFVHTLREFNGELFMAGGLREITYPNGDTQECNAIVSYSNGQLSTLSGGIPNNDIEAIEVTEDNQLLIGGGVFGNGYTAISDGFLSTGFDSAEESFGVFPNPSADVFNVSSSKNYSSYAIYDQVGRLVEKGRFQNPLRPNLENGVYILSLIDEQGRVSFERIVKKS